MTLVGSSGSHFPLSREKEPSKTAYKPIPIIPEVSPEMVDLNFLHIRQEVDDIVSSEMQRMLADPELEGLIIRK